MATFHSDLLTRQISTYRDNEKAMQMYPVSNMPEATVIRCVEDQDRPEVMIYKSIFFFILYLFQKALIKTSYFNRMQLNNIYIF